jgi:nitrogen regulatory protein P-II 1
VKKIEAIVKPFGVDELKHALSELGINGLTATEVEGSSRRRGQASSGPGAESADGLEPKVKIEVVVPDELAGRAVEVIERAAKIGHVGDGLICTTPVEEAVRVRTGERGEGAL